MNVFVLAGQTSIVISGSDPIVPDKVQVVITNANTDLNVVNVSYSTVPKAQNYPVDPGTYIVSVYWNHGNSASIFYGVIVPPSNGNLLDPNTNTPEGIALKNSGAPAGKYLHHNPSNSSPPG